MQLPLKHEHIKGDSKVTLLETKKGQSNSYGNLFKHLVQNPRLPFELSLRRNYIHYEKANVLQTRRRQTNSHGNLFKHLVQNPRLPFELSLTRNCI